MKFLVAAVLALSGFSSLAHADDVIRVTVGDDYSKYSNDELRRRVWQLERAVAQLQDQVFQLAIRNGGASAGTGNWTCSMQSFGKTLVASGNTKASALAQVLKKCSDASNAVHCHEADATCGNE